MMKSGLLLPPNAWIVVTKVLLEGLITGLFGTDPVNELRRSPYKRQWQVCDRSGRLRPVGTPPEMTAPWLSLSTD